MFGPQFVSPSDILAALIVAARLALAEQHYAPDPREQRRQYVVYTGRQAKRRRYPTHGVSEFQDLVA